MYIPLVYALKKMAVIVNRELLADELKDKQI